MNTIAPTVLVADDNPIIRRWLRLLLSAEGYDVWEAEDGNGVLEILDSATRVDAVLLDLLMPGREGLETIQAIRRRSASPRIVAMSGALEPMYLEVARMLGADAALAKPFTPTALRAALRGTDTPS